MNRDDILNIFKQTGALLEGHFLLTSGLHSDRYFQCAVVLQHPGHCEALSRELAKQFAGEKIDVVIGPALGGVTLAYEVGRALGARALFAERESGVMTLRRGFSVSPAERVLVVEDVVTTGGSVKEVIEFVRKAGAVVAGVGSIVDRSAGKAGFDCRFASLVKMDVVNYRAETCPLCLKGIPVVKPGSRPRVNT